jgi:uncharacterized membrane protein YedE/YeeE
MIESIIYAIIGGALIGIAASALMLTAGRVAGISGIVGSLLQPRTGDIGWRMAFVGGLLMGGLVLVFTTPGVIVEPATRGIVAVTLAGLFVGLGVRMGEGCTSGHGVCGLTRFSFRSLVATLTFMGTGFATATAIQLFNGGVL